MKVVSAILFILLFLGLFVVSAWVLNNSEQILAEFRKLNDTPPKTIKENVAVYFRDKIREGTVDRVGQPIEGFEPFMLMQAFPNLTKKDFDGVGAELGVYQYNETGLDFIMDSTNPVHSAARAITNNGMTTLLKNVSSRLNQPTTTIDDIESVLVALRGDQYETRVPGRINGILSISPICPVEREGVPCPVPPAAYAARPIIVKDVNGREVTRVIAAPPNGVFQIEVAAGTYDVVVVSASVLENISPQRVIVGADSNVSIRFEVDTGIR